MDNGSPKMGVLNTINFHRSRVKVSYERLGRLFNDLCTIAQPDDEWKQITIFKETVITSVLNELQKTTTPYFEADIVVYMMYYFNF